MCPLLDQNPLPYALAIPVQPTLSKWLEMIPLSVASKCKNQDSFSGLGWGEVCTWHVADSGSGWSLHTGRLTALSSSPRGFSSSSRLIWVHSQGREWGGGGWYTTLETRA